MKNEAKIGFADCIKAFFLSLLFTVLGVVVAVAVNVLFGKLFNFLTDIKYIGVICEIIGGIIGDTFIGDIFVFILNSVVGLAAGFGCKMVFGRSSEKSSNMRTFTEVLCFLTALAATIFTYFTVITINLVWMTEGGVSPIDAFKLSPRLFVYSEKIPLILMIIWKGFVSLANAFIGFIVGTEC